MSSSSGMSDPLGRPLPHAPLYATAVLALTLITASAWAFSTWSVRPFLDTPRSSAST